MERVIFFFFPFKSREISKILIEWCKIRSKDFYVKIEQWIMVIFKDWKF